ncbi:Putative D-isomer specific 2-hydroxyacid dehydrogenase NAD-binding protein [Sodalis praecaptivus]|uniref:Putative D-isomer specific 2-hydroxyacid dehydrogenase NAD-binding protein n=1 Tax=Sodalis praecaptivus TaxID=1239307 RepID=W0HYL1_9GAMM|nr:2-hydroxyacid dehydrogenase [Sodalis praecaptivus]AHF77305.1 Putative D-isomer specific 2-hydroxyacid dehydrogenase NAD-binding protein [Sodalis praecaptivus]
MTKTLHVLIAAETLPASLLDAVKRTYTVSTGDAARDPAWSATYGAEIDVILTNGVTGVTAELLRRLPKVKLIASNGVGVDKIDLAAARARGIVVTNTPSVLNDCVADHAMALLLDISRRVSEADRYVRAGLWRTRGRFPLGTKIGGKVCGIAGLGNIGRAFAARAAAFGMDIHYYNPHSQPAVPYRRHDSLRSLAAAADYLVLTLPGGDATRHAVEETVLAALGPRGYLINVARGSVVKESALLDALDRQLIAGAALDVFADEPNVPPALLDKANVVLSPHIASATRETMAAMADLVLQNLHAFARGEAVLTPVN